MQRLAFLMSIRPGTEQAYDHAHQCMSEELYDVYHRAGLRNWTMFRLGTQVVGYVECEDDVRAALAVVARHPLERAFNDALADVFVPEGHRAYGARELEEVWHGW